MIIQSRDNETIIAQCTPKGPGAIALIRMSGAGALELASSISRLPGNARLIDQQSHTIAYGWVTGHDGADIDQVLFLVMHGPRTFTGEHTVEITCHNNPFIIDQIIDRAIACGARHAQEGEFSRRAVMNGKMDLTQAEGINELIGAQTQHALKRSLAQVTGSLSQQITQLEKELIKALALCEASFEFIDEEMEFAPEINRIVSLQRDHIARMKEAFSNNRQIKEGVRVALVGSVNAGKSSLFNALLNRERSIVTNIAGTTRDSIEAGLYANGAFITLVDTAGLRQTDDVVEQAGIERSCNEAELADILIIIIDGSRAITPAEEAVYKELLEKHSHKAFLVRTKSDLPACPVPLLDALPHYPVSTSDHLAITGLNKAISERIDTIFSTSDSPFLLNKRQFHLLSALDTDLAALQTRLEGKVEYELVSYHLNDAIARLAEITGKTISEASMDAVFREFCVGK